MDLDAILSAFRDRLAGQEYGSDQQAAYEERAEHYLSWLENQPFDHDADPTQLERYVRHLRTNGDSADVIAFARHAVAMLRQLR